MGSKLQSVSSKYTWDSIERQEVIWTLLFWTTKYNLQKNQKARLHGKSMQKIKGAYFEEQFIVKCKAYNILEVVLVGTSQGTK